jgi:chromosome segregation ATPase
MQKQKEAHDLAGSFAPTRQMPPKNETSDFELEFETRYANMVAQNRDLIARNSVQSRQIEDLEERLANRNATNEDLTQRLKTAEEELEKGEHDEEIQNKIRYLNEKITERDAIIEGYESQMMEQQDKIDDQEKQLKKVGDAPQQLRALRDEVSGLRYENEILTKKANSVEHYKQKLERVRELEGEKEDLEAELEQYKNESNETTELKRQIESLKTAQSRYQTALSQLEVELYESNHSRQTLVHDTQILHERLDAAERKVEEYQEMNDNLHARLMNATGRPGLFDDSDDESDAAKKEADLGNEMAANDRAVEVSRLKAEIALLRRDADPAMANAELRKQIDVLQANFKALQAKYEGVFGELGAAREQLRQLLMAEGDATRLVEIAHTVAPLGIMDPDFARDTVVKDLTLQLSSARDEVAVLNKRNIKLASELEETKRKLLQSETELGAIDEDESQALENLKSMAETINRTTQDELTELLGKYGALEVEYELHKEMLFNALKKKELMEKQLRESVEAWERLVQERRDGGGEAKGGDGEEEKTKMPHWLNVSPPLSPEVSQEPGAAADAHAELERVAEELRAEKAAFGILVLPEDYPLPDVPDSPGFFCPSPEVPDGAFVLGSDSEDSAPIVGSPAESVELSDTGSAEIDKLFENVPLTPELLGTGFRQSGHSSRSRRANSPRFGLGVFGTSSAGGEDTGATGKRSPLFASPIFSKLSPQSKSKSRSAPLSPRSQSSRGSSPISAARLRHRLRRQKSLDTLLAYSARVARAETAARREQAEREARAALARVDQAVRQAERHELARARKAEGEARRAEQEARMKRGMVHLERARRFLARDEAVERERVAAERQDGKRAEAATVLGGVKKGLERLSGWFGESASRDGGASASASSTASASVPLRSLSTPSKHGMPEMPGDM